MTIKNLKFLQQVTDSQSPEAHKFILSDYKGLLEYYALIGQAIGENKPVDELQKSIFMKFFSEDNSFCSEEVTVDETGKQDVRVIFSIPARFFISNREACWQETTSIPFEIRREAEEMVSWINKNKPESAKDKKYNWLYDVSLDDTIPLKFKNTRADYIAAYVKSLDKSKEQRLRLFERVNLRFTIEELNAMPQEIGAWLDQIIVDESSVENEDEEENFTENGDAEQTTTITVEVA